MESGRTSSVSQRLMGFDAKGAIVNHDAACQRGLSWGELVSRSSKLITFFDLAGPSSPNPRLAL